MTGRYADEYRALARAEALKRHGTWPGVIHHADGSCDLTSDPQEATS